MDPVLDETSLVPYPEVPASGRVEALAQALKAMDLLGFARTLRTVRDAADRDVEGGFGLRRWCFDRDVTRESRLLVANRLSKQPFIDGPDGLFSVAERQRVVEASVEGDIVWGLGLAALEDGVAVGLTTASRNEGAFSSVSLHELDDDSEFTHTVDVFVHVVAADISRRSAQLRSRIERTVVDGRLLIGRFSELFSNLVLGPLAEEQLASLRGSEPQFRQLLRHLLCLDRSARAWKSKTPFVPAGITSSVESTATLQHGRFGPMRDFPVPPGYQPFRWSLHTKMTGGDGARMYYEPRPEEAPDQMRVLVGYFGSHLPCVKYPT